MEKDIPPDKADATSPEGHGDSDAAQVTELVTSTAPSNNESEIRDVPWIKEMNQS